MSQHSRSLLIAGLFAPWVSRFPFAVRVIATDHSGSGLLEAPTSISAVLFLAVPFGNLGMILLVLSFAVWLRRRSRLCLMYLVLSGFVLAGLPLSIHAAQAEDVPVGGGVFASMGLIRCLRRSCF